nr:hypothetical protein OG409_14195 [Streptomyces sp. NBC_00974]
MPYRARPLVITFVAVSAALFLFDYLYTAREEPGSVKWDLSHGHAKTDVNWAGKSRSTWEISSPEYDITFSGGIHLTGKRMLRLDADPDTGTVESVHIIYPSMSTDDAYRAAKDLAKELSMDTANVDRWYEQRTGGREAGHEGVTSTSGMSPARHTPGAPYVDASLLYSFDAEKPTFIDLSFYWPNTEE